MIATLFRWIAALSATALLVVAVLGVWLAWRLREGPLPVPVLDPYVERAFAGRDPDLDVKLAGTVIVWAADRRLPELRVLGLRLSRHDGRVVADLPEVAFRPSFRALLRGRLAIGGVVVRGVKLSLTRDPEGRLFLTGTTPTEADPNAPSPLAWLTDTGDPNAANAFLRRVSIRDAEIALDDRLSIRKWSAKEASLDVTRRSRGIEAELRALLQVRMKDGAVHLPLTAKIEAAFGEGSTIGDVEFAGRGAAGRFDRAGEDRPPLEIRSFEVAGRFTAAGEMFELRDLRLDTGTASVRATGSFAGVAKETKFDGEVANLPVEDLDLAWPEGVAAGARNWVLGNLRDGRITSAKFSMHRVKEEHAKFRLSARVAEMTIDYLAPLEPLRGVEGDVTVDEKKVEAAVSKGNAGNLALTRAALAIDLQTAPATLRVDADVDGPTDDVLAYLDSPRLGYPSRFGIPTAGIGGRTSGRIELRFPLAGAETGSKLEVDAHAALSGGTTEGTVAVAVAGGAVRKVEVERLRSARNDFSGSLTAADDGSYRASIRGERLDFRPLLERLRSADGDGLGDGRDYEVTFDLAAVTMSNDVDVASVRGTVRSVGGRFERIDASGVLEGGGATKILLEPVQGRRRLRASSADAGRLIQAFGLIEGAKGGRLELYAFSDDRGAEPATTGRLDVTDLVITDAPLLARVLGLASFDGMADAFRGDGMRFQRARVAFGWKKDTITVTDGRAIGAIGLTAEGTIRTGDGGLDLRGEVIPAYTLNTALGKVPWIGELFSGGKAGGLFGISYRVKGTRKSPDVTVNPLTALAPGKLREMFVSPWGR